MSFPKVVSSADGCSGDHESLEAFRDRVILETGQWERRLREHEGMKDKLRKARFERSRMEWENKIRQPVTKGVVERRNEQIMSKATEKVECLEYSIPQDMGRVSESWLLQGRSLLLDVEEALKSMRETSSALSHSISEGSFSQNQTTSGVSVAWPGRAHYTSKLTKRASESRGGSRGERVLKSVRDHVEGFQSTRKGKAARLMQPAHGSETFFLYGF